MQTLVPAPSLFIGVGKRGKGGMRKKETEGRNRPVFQSTRGKPNKGKHHDSRVQEKLEEHHHPKAAGRQGATA